MTTHELIKNSQHILIALSEHPNEKEMQTALTIACGLSKLKKNVSIEKGTLVPQITISTPSSQNEKAFVVSLRGLAPWISRISWERDKKDIKLYFTLQQGASSAFHSPTIQTQADLTITGENNQADARSITTQLLLAHHNPQVKLLGKVLWNLEYAAAQNFYTTLLPLDDLQVLDANPRMFALLIEDLKESFGTEASYLVLYESSASLNARGLLWSPSQSVRNNVLHETNGDQKGNWVLFAGHTRELQQVRSRILSLS